MLNKKLLTFTDAFPQMLGSEHRDLIVHLKHFFENHKYTQNLDNNKIYFNCLWPAFPGKSWDRYFTGSKKMATKERVPLLLELAVTGRCPYNCWHCYRGPYKNKSTELDAEVIRKIINDAYDMGTVVVGITGGEPMLRKDIIDILEMIPDGMEGLLYTCGINVTEDFVKRLSKTNVTRCYLSLDHYSKEKVDKSRGFNGAYELALNAIKLLNSINLYTGITLCITDEINNEEIFNTYLNFANSLNVDEVRLVLPISHGNLAGNNYKKLYVSAMRWSKQARLNNVNNKMPNIFLMSEWESHSFAGCGAGSTLVSINNDGALAPCPAIPLAISNAATQGFKTAYAELGKYFKSTGKTCYGKRIVKPISEIAVDSPYNILPYPKEISQKVVAEYPQDEANADFFRCIEDFMRTHA